MAVGVICEFNPFHNGHKYLLDEIKRKYNEPIVAVMSGAFTQRGEVALCDKFNRAKTALENGADLVLELPATFVLSGAESFAAAGVKILSAFPQINRLAFGSECGEVNLLCRTANAVNDERVQNELCGGMKNGGYYPRELQKAVNKVYGGEVSAVLSQPNNILGLEYIKAINRFGVSNKIKPCTFARKGAEHDAAGESGGISSAAHIRELLRSGKPEAAQKLMPCKITEFTRSELLDRVILYKIRGMTAEMLSQLPEVSEGLENRILSAARVSASAAELADNIKTKRYTHARIRRSIACALLDIRKADIQTPIEYARVLGFTENGSRLLKGCSLNVVTSAARGLEQGENIQKLLKIDIAASNIQALCYDVPQPSGRDFTARIVKV